MLSKSFSFILIIAIAMTNGCTNPKTDSGKERKKDSTYSKGSFGYDLSFLKGHDEVIVLSDTADQAKVIVSAKYQGKVFTSTAAGDGGKSFGWINYKAFTGAPNAHMNAYGGENRFWLGPEGGKYSLFFPKGSKMVFDNWKTPAAFDTETWEVVSKDQGEIHLRKNMVLMNYAGTELQIGVERSVTLMPAAQIFSLLHLSPERNLL